LSTNAVSLGKRNLHEFAYGFTNTNPHWGYLSQSVGSRAGSRWVERRRPRSRWPPECATLALGTDTGRLESGFPLRRARIAGLIPTYGSREPAPGVLSAVVVARHVGALWRARSEDVALLFAVIAGGL
jgi:aspartyl-tRNA(Asn)/glutamyl-tRNA(Gln) amidotransferase subunit A